MPPLGRARRTPDSYGLPGSMCQWMDPAVWKPRYGVLGGPKIGQTIALLHRSNRIDHILRKRANGDGIEGGKPRGSHKRRSPAAWSSESL